MIWLMALSVLLAGNANSATECGPSTEPAIARTQKEFCELYPALRNLAYEEASYKFESQLAKRRGKLGSARFAPALLSHGKPTEYAVVLTHSLYQSPEIMQQTAKYLHERGMTVLMPLLPGHREKDGPALDRVTAADWEKEVRENVALARAMGRKVILGGYSVGGLISTKIATEDAGIDGLILWSPAMQPRYAIEALTNVVAPTGLTGNRLRGIPFDPEHTPYFSLKAGREVSKLAGKYHQLYGPAPQEMDAMSAPLPSSSTKDVYGERLTMPVFLADAKGDDAVEVAVNEKVFRGVKGPYVRAVVEGNHYHAMGRMEEAFEQPGRDAESDELVKKLKGFLDQNFPTEANSSLCAE